VEAVNKRLVQGWAAQYLLYTGGALSTEVLVIDRQAAQCDRTGLAIEFARKTRKAEHGSSDTMESHLERAKTASGDGDGGGGIAAVVAL
jgi:hypothetical protein